MHFKWIAVNLNVNSVRQSLLLKHAPASSQSLTQNNSLSYNFSLILLLYGATTSPLFFLGTPVRPENHGHMQRPLSIPLVHPLPSLAILSHSLSYSTVAAPNNLLSLCHYRPAPIYSPPRTTTSITSTFLNCSVIFRFY